MPVKGHHQSKRACKAIGDALRGKPKSAEHIKHMHTRFKPGHIPWNAGTKGMRLQKPYIRTSAIKRKNSESNLGASYKRSESFSVGSTVSLQEQERLKTAYPGKVHPWTSEYNHNHKKGGTLTKDHKDKIRKTTHRIRQTTSPIWNKGLSKEIDPRIAAMALHLSVTQKGIPRPYVTQRQGIRRFWYYGCSGRIKMRSRWEVAYAHYLDRNRIKWLYEPVTYLLPQYSYTPDFLLVKNQTFVEIKGYLSEYDAIKLNVFRRHYLCVVLHMLMTNDLQELGLLDAHGRVIPVERSAPSE